MPNPPLHRMRLRRIGELCVGRDVLVTTDDKFLVWVSVSLGSLLIGLISYCLFRGLKSGVMVIVSARRGRMSEFRRRNSPGEYWLLFVFWLILILVIMWLVVGRVYELRHRNMPNNRAGVDAGLAVLFAFGSPHPGTTHHGR
jgi:hypothetical protein